MLGALSPATLVSGGDLLPCIERNHRGRDGCCTILCLTNVGRLPNRKLTVQRLFRLGSLYRGRRARVYFGVCITMAYTGRRFVNNRQADQGSTGARGTRTSEQLLREKCERERDWASVCLFLVGLSPHTSELMFRSAGHFRMKRQDQRHGVDGFIAMWVQ